MNTILWASPIYGPVVSRRMGVSLGINLAPADGKACTFDCLYCECGLNGERRTSSPRPSRQLVAKELEHTLRQMQTDGMVPDVITFAGNGEPTGHPDFLGVIQDTIRLRDAYCPKAKISVLSNATLCGRPSVREALMLVDNNILKLDTVDMDYIRLVDRPTSPSYDVLKVIGWMQAFQGQCVVQTMFMTGAAMLPDDNGKLKEFSTDNTSDCYVIPWLQALEVIRPRQVMIYTIDRTTPVRGLQKASPAQLDAIALRVRELGIECTVSY